MAKKEKDPNAPQFYFALNTGEQIVFVRCSDDTAGEIMKDCQVRLTRLTKNPDSGSNWGNKFIQ